MKRSSPDYTIRTYGTMPEGLDLAEKFFRRLSGRRKPKRKYANPPADAELVLQMHFNVYSFGKNSFHADMTLEIPTDKGFEYFSLSASDKTSAGAMRQVLSSIENSRWFSHFKARKVYFSVTGAGMDELYRGFL